MDVYELLEMYLSSLTEALDPHTNYMAPRAQDNFKIQLGLQLQGIGATLKSEDGITVIAGTVPGGAAHRDGRLKEGDRITAVGQEASPEMVDVVDMKLDDVVSLIRGPAGTKVRLTVQPKIGSESTTIEITRLKSNFKTAPLAVKFSNAARNPTVASIVWVISSFRVSTLIWTAIVEPKVLEARKWTSIEF